MRKHAQRPRAIAVMGLLVTLVAACGGQPSHSSTVGGQSQAATSAGGQSASASSPGGQSAPASAASGASSAALQQLYAQAKQEGSVNWYAPKAPTQMKAAIAAFESAYPGVKVNYTDKQAPDQVTQLQLEQAGKHVTIDVANAGGLTVVTAESQLAQVDWAKYGVASSQIFDKNFVYIWAVPKVWAYNTKMVSASDAPKTWQDLLDPQWKNGKIGMESRGSFMTVWTTDSTLGGTAPAVAFAKKLAAQNPHFTANATDAHTLLTSGQVALASTLMNNVLASQAKGAPIALAPLSPVTTNEAYLWVPKGAPHPAAAALLAAYLSSPAGETALAKGNNSLIPANTDCSAAATNNVVKALCAAHIQWEGTKSVAEYQELSTFLPDIQKALGASAAG